MEQYIIRKATCDDIWFLIETIIEAEKSNTDKFGLSTLFELTEEEVRSCLKLMLEEEVDGCEFSVSSFMVAEINGSPVAATAGWIEGENTNSMPSFVLKANLLKFTIPNSKLLNVNSKADIIKDILIDRENGTLQIEYVYIKKEHRGKGLLTKLINAHAKLCSLRNPNIKYMQVQLFANNIAALSSYQKAGFMILSSFDSSDDQILEFLPGKTKLLMQRTII
jgi:ribosomal protein S18 acetylase RimI-like enzyme